MGADGKRFAGDMSLKALLGDGFGNESTTPDPMGTVSTSIDNAFAVRRPRGCSRGLWMLVAWGAVTMKKSAIYAVTDTTHQHNCSTHTGASHRRFIILP